MPLAAISTRCCMIVAGRDQGFQPSLIQPTKRVDGPTMQNILGLIVNPTRIFVLCLWCAFTLPFESAATERPVVHEDLSTSLGVGGGFGTHSLPTLRLEWRPIPWMSVAGRIGWSMGIWQHVSGDDGISSWIRSDLALTSTGLQMSGIWPISDGHAATLRAGADMGFPLDTSCTGSENYVSCPPSSLILLDASVGWSRQIKMMEVRLDLGAIYVKSLDPDSTLATYYPTFLFSALYWFL